MRLAPPVQRLCLAAIASAMFFFTARGRAGPFDVAGRDWEGCSDFVQLAREKLGQDLFVVDRVRFRELRADDSLILIHPERRLDDYALSMFMAAGGRVILLDDYGTGDALLRRYAIQRLQPPRRPERALRRNPAFAIAEATGDHALVRDLTLVVTNHPTVLVQPALTPLLQIPNLDGDSAVVALAGVVANGRLVAVGDPSLVMNSMLRYPGNKQFAENLIAFASRDDDPITRGKVYLASGAFEQSGVFPGSSELTHASRSAEDVLEDVRHGGLGPRSAYALAAVVGLGIVVWVGSKAGRTYR